MQAIAYSIVGTLIVWLLKVLITYTYKRNRFRAGLLKDINLHLLGAKEQKNAVDKLLSKTLKTGQKIPYPITYNPGIYSFYSAVQKDLPVYLNKDELVRIIMFYQKLWELDVSLNGLANTISIWERDKIALNEQNIEHLNNRKNRIDTLYIGLSTNSIEKISNLPKEYNLVKRADTVV